MQKDQAQNLQVNKHFSIGHLSFPGNPELVSGLIPFKRVFALQPVFDVKLGHRPPINSGF
jgi:hypothetical protein